MDSHNRKKATQVIFSRSGASDKTVYIVYIFMALLIMGALASIQILSFYGELKPGYYIMPGLIGLTIGSLLARAAILKSRLLHKSQQFRAIADLAMEFTSYRTIGGVYEYVSPSVLDLTGHTPDEFYREPEIMDRLIHPDDLELWRDHVHLANSGGDTEKLDLRLISKDRDIVWVTHLCSPVHDETGNLIGIRSTNMDITERKLYEERVRHMAYYDSLTDLPNRRALEREIAESIEKAGSGDSFVLFFLNLNRFKNINDSFGHAFGDRLLVKIARRIDSFRESDLLVYRFGGDEFALLSRDIDSDEESIRVARTLLATLEIPIAIDDAELYISCNIGIAFYPRDGETPDALISSADAAMYQGKDSGGAKANIYTASLSDRATRFMTTESKIHKGLENGEFVVYYQPKVDLASGRITGAEALVRWLHPEQGEILPGEFIPVAEETGQIIAMGEEILHQALRDLTSWQQQRISVPIAINVSARQFSNHAFCERSIDYISHSGCDVSQVEFEVTEQVFLGNIEQAREKLQRLREAGISIALDDFGTGYSSLMYIKRLPIDTLKIDRSFIWDIGKDDKSSAILKAMLTLSRDLELEAVAEGVETDEQREFLCSLNCSTAQGFLFYRPMSRDDLELLLQQQKKVAVEAPLEKSEERLTVL